MFLCFCFVSHVCLSHVFLGELVTRVPWPYSRCLDVDHLPDDPHGKGSTVQGIDWHQSEARTES